MRQGRRIRWQHVDLEQKKVERKVKVNNDNIAKSTEPVSLRINKIMIPITGG